MFWSHAERPRSCSSLCSSDVLRKLIFIQPDRLREFVVDSGALKHITPTVLPIGKHCDENGYSYEWINGQKPHLIKFGIRIICNTENFVPIVVPGLSSSSSGSSQTPMKKRASFFFNYFILTFFTYNKMKFRFEQGKMHPELVDDWLGNLRKSKPTKFQKQIKRKPR